MSPIFGLDQGYCIWNSFKADNAYQVT